MILLTLTNQVKLLQLKKLQGMDDTSCFAMQEIWAQLGFKENWKLSYSPNYDNGIPYTQQCFTNALSNQGLVYSKHHYVENQIFT